MIAFFEGFEVIGATVVGIFVGEVVISVILYVFKVFTDLLVSTSKTIVKIRNR